MEELEEGDPIKDVMLAFVAAEEMYKCHLLLLEM